MPRTRTTRVYLKGSRYYGDFRDLGGKLEALKPPGSSSATDNVDVATDLATARVKELESIKRGIQLVGVGAITRLGEFAEYHLKQKKLHGECTDWTLGGVQRCLERAVEYFGSNRPLAAIKVIDVKEWANWLRKNYSGREGNATLSPGSLRHHLNSLSNLYARANEEDRVPAGYNPVRAWGRTRPKGKPKEAHWLEPHEAALLLQACKLYKPEREDVAIPSLYAIVATSLLTGGRPAEVRGLAVSDVSFERKTITFREHPWRRLKTLGSARVVRLWPQLETILREYLESPAAPKGRLLFPSTHRRVRGREEEVMIGDIRKALDAVAIRAGWAEGEIRPYSFRHSFTAARLQTLDHGAPVSTFTVARELGHGGDALVRKIYGHLGQVRARSEVVEFRPAAITLIEDAKEREKFEKRFEIVQRHLRLVA